MAIKPTHFTERLRSTSFLMVALLLIGISPLPAVAAKSHKKERDASPRSASAPAPDKSNASSIPSSTLTVERILRDAAARREALIERAFQFQNAQAIQHEAQQQAQNYALKQSISAAIGDTKAKQIERKLELQRSK